jgi:hypothetical protein
VCVVCMVWSVWWLSVCVVATVAIVNSIVHRFCLSSPAQLSAAEKA